MNPDQLAAALEWVSFFMLAPEFLGERRLKGMSEFLLRQAHKFFTRSAFKLARAQSGIPPESLRKHLTILLRETREVFWHLVWDHAFLLVALGCLALPWPWKWIGVGLTSLVLAGAVMLALNTDWMRLLGRPHSTRAYLVSLPMLLGLSLFRWGATLVVLLTYLMVHLADSDVLRGSIFVAGVLLFTFSKAIPFFK